MARNEASQNRRSYSYSNAVTYGMPGGRGRKPNQAPRKRGGRRKHPSTDNVKTFSKLELTEDRQSYPQAFAQSTVQQQWAS